MFLFFGFFKEKHIQRERERERERECLVFCFFREVYGFCAFAFTFSLARAIVVV
jgi:hypothetical protein